MLRISGRFAQREIDNVRRRRTIKICRTKFFPNWPLRAPTRATAISQSELRAYDWLTKGTRHGRAHTSGTSLSYTRRNTTENDREVRKVRVFQRRRHAFSRGRSRHEVLCREERRSRDHRLHRR